MKVLYAPRALRDLHAIEDYLAQRSAAGTRSVLAAIKSAISDLESFPRIGIPIDAEGRYRLPVVGYPYIVLYRVAGDIVFILHVRHAAMAPIEPRDL